MWQIISNWESLVSLLIGLGTVGSIGYYCYARIYSKVKLIYEEFLPNGGNSIRDKLDKLTTLWKASLKINEKPFTIFNNKGELIEFADSLCELTNRSPNYLYVNGWINIVDEEDIIHIMSHWSIALDKRIEFRQEYNLVRADGKKIKVLDKRIPMFSGDNFIGFFGCISQL